MNNQETNQPETVAPVTDNQTTPVTPVADNKPAEKADSTQGTTANTPVAPTVSESVKLDLSADQEEMVQDLLSNFVYAYRSDREVDCKRELVRRDQVGKYPYIAEAPDPSIVNPIYDWIGKKWYSKTGATSLPEIAQAVKTLQSDQQAGTTQNLALTKAVKALSDGQASTNKVMASMQQILLKVSAQLDADNKTADKSTEPAEPEATAATESEKPANN